MHGKFQCDTDIPEGLLGLRRSMPSRDGPTSAPQRSRKSDLVRLARARATRGPVWEAQQQRISRALHGFDGRKICAISVDESTDADGVDRGLWDEVVQLPMIRCSERSPAGVG